MTSQILCCHKYASLIVMSDVSVVNITCVIISYQVSYTDSVNNKDVSIPHHAMK